MNNSIWSHEEYVRVLHYLRPEFKKALANFRWRWVVPKKVDKQFNRVLSYVKDRYEKVLQPDELEHIGQFDTIIPKSPKEVISMIRANGLYYLDGTSSGIVSLYEHLNKNTDYCYQKQKLLDLLFSGVDMAGDKQVKGKKPYSKPGIFNASDDLTQEAREIQNDIISFCY